MNVTDTTAGRDLKSTRCLVEFRDKHNYCYSTELTISLSYQPSDGSTIFANKNSVIIFLCFFIWKITLLIRSTQRLQISAEAADSTIFLQLLLSHSSKTSVKNSRIWLWSGSVSTVVVARETSHPTHPKKFHNNLSTTSWIIIKTCTTAPILR